jgi:TolB-like protein
MKIIRFFSQAIIITIVFLCFSCGGKLNSSFFINQDIDFSYIKKVAVLPFDNLSNDRFAGETIRQIVTSELLNSGLVDVAYPGDVNSIIESLKIKPAHSPNSEQIKSIGNALKVQAVILGTVNKCGEIREGNISSYEVSLSLMMADVSSGSIIWSVTRNSTGANIWAKYFGAKSDTMSETIIKVVRDSIKTLYEYEKR